ncbi:RimJ/RimL family protein N-acetyltransferase [Paenibacillus anaericanus]|uniref:N-acetyltransferase domain-containing protein n=1 Tax=Paenibacillus anaericanus TaxID=170367 RepID=A0A433XXG6_9BACL|nr:GNAT family N-acetyltransferase [Paenibacillus anaericanus]MDQ0087267.1 RimJ/RimL family protein N-acetyltransferase [Paenibacillus anaericanus]RUT39622.1 hypothetical protein EJP82_25835 [Paenibacillus anaericanus]
MLRVNPFETCPVYETEFMLFTLVKEEDAADLFECYTDPITKSHMNNDNCGGVWNIHGIEPVLGAIRSWNKVFKEKFFIRWSITNKPTNKVIGTIEIAPIPNTTRFLDGECKIGILRIDMISSCENESTFSEILNMVTNHFFDDFAIERILTKAEKIDTERVIALKNCKFSEVPDKSIIPYQDYYLKERL